MWYITWFRARADGSRPAGTRLGVIADRVASAKPLSAGDHRRPDVDDDERRGVHRAAPASSRTDPPAWAIWAISSSRRRSWRSMSGPPNSDADHQRHELDQADRPTAAAEPVRRYTWMKTATSVMLDPVSERISPIQSSRKSRWRSGVRSTASGAQPAAESPAHEAAAVNRRPTSHIPTISLDFCVEAPG